MKSFKHYLLAAALASIAAMTLLLAPQHAAKADRLVMCLPPPSAAQAGARPFLGYSLNSQGCSVVQLADIPSFLAAGAVPAEPFSQPLFAVTGTWTGTTSIQVGVLPASAWIQQVLFSNSTANAVSGGIAVGSTAGGNDIVTATACAANCVTGSTILKAAFSTTLGTPIFITPVTSGGNANVTATVIFAYF